MKYIATATNQRVVFRKITKFNRPLITIYERLYRIDEELFCSDVASNTSFVLYDLDDQQPYGYGDYLDPEMTRTLINSLRLRKGKIKNMMDFNFENIIMIMVVAFVGYSLLSSIITGQGVSLI